MTNIMIRHCTQEEIQEIINLHTAGVPASRIAPRMGLHPKQVLRYIRVFDRYGIDVFITQATRKL